MRTSRVAFLPSVIARLEVDAIAIVPLAATEPFAELGPPEGVEVTPVTVQPVGHER